MGELFTVFVDHLSNYSYASCQNLLQECGYEDTDIFKLMRSFKYALNFDFEYAMKLLETTTVKFKHTKDYREIKLNLTGLIEGRPDAIFCELMFNIKMQVWREEYVDFLGRLYRYREAVLKYLFLQTQGLRPIGMLTKEMSKRFQLDMLKEKYDIHVYNLGLAIVQYFRKYQTKDYAVMRVLDILDSPKMLELMNLRNESIIGHGFHGVSIRDIEAVYGDVDELLGDVLKSLAYTGLKIDEEKYDRWNNSIVIMAKELAGFSDK